MAFVYKQQGKYEKALEISKLVLETKVRVCGGNSPSVAATCKDMQVVHQEKGEWDRAVEYGEKEWNINRVVFWEDHAKA